MTGRDGWQHPGRRGALLYTVAAGMAGVGVAAMARRAVARQPGRRSDAQQLPGGPIIVVSNHTSYADGILLALACRDLGRSVRLLATAGVFRMPLIGSVADRLGFIPVQRGSSHAADSLEQAAQALAHGEAVALFPEGRITREQDHWPERAKTGAVRLALRSGAPVIPVAMDGAHEVIGDRAHLLRLLRNLALPPQVRVLVGEPIDVTRLVGSVPDEQSVRRVADEVMGTLVDLVEQLRGQPAPSAEWRGGAAGAPVGSHPSDTDVPSGADR
ncbi:MAG: lysophospholipid acyltransferase family protein [Nostocoides sp.]